MTITIDNDILFRENSLTEEEKNRLVPIIARGLVHHTGKQNLICKEAILKGLERNVGIKISSVKLAKLIRYIRHHDIVPLVMSNSRGYWVASSLEECIPAIQMFDDRRNAEYYTMLKLIDQVQNRYGVDISVKPAEEAVIENEYQTVFVREM